MIKALRYFFSSIFFYVIFCVGLQAIQVSFKTNWDGKTVYLSSSTCKFLKIIVPEFEKWICRLKQTSNPEVGSLACLRREMLDLFRCFRNSDKIDGKDIERLGVLLYQAQAALVLTMKTQQFGEINKHLHKLIKEIGIDLSVAVRQVYVGTAEADLKVIDNYLRHPQKEYTVTVHELIQDIIKHFDGVAITEYDFVVLTACSLFVLLSIE